MEKVLAVITARGGSKRIPRKNIKDFLGRPVLAYSVEAALAAGIFDEIMVSTEDEEIAQTAAAYGAAVPFLRSKKNAGDYATTEEVIMEVLLEYEKADRYFDYVACLYPAAPFIRPEWLRSGLEQVRQPGVGMVMTIVRYAFPPQRCLVREGAFVKYRWSEYMNTRSQDLEPLYHDGGQFYYYDVREFQKRKGLFADGIGAIELPEREVHDIDTPEDWKTAEMKYKLLYGLQERQKKVLMLGAGPLQVPAIQELKKMGAYVICLDQNPQAEGFLYADEAKSISTMDTEAICAEFQRQQADVVMTSTSDAPVRVVSEVSERLGLTGALSYEDACAVTIKSRMRERLKEYRVPIPEYRVIHSVEELFHAYDDIFSQRCILKPADSSGSRGVKLLEGQFCREDLKTEYDICRKYTRSGILLAEEVMDGPEVSVEAMTVEGQTTVLAITDKIVCPKPYFVEIGHAQPSLLPEIVRKQIHAITKKAIRAMNIRNGPSHTEIIVTKDGPKIVEIAARLGGDYITSRLVPLSTGIPMVRESVRLSLGKTVTLKPRWRKGAAIRFLISDTDGIFLRADGILEAEKEEGIREISLYVKPGERVHALRSSSDRLGHIIADGDCTEEALEHVQSAYEKIHIVLEENRWK